MSDCRSCNSEGCTLPDDLAAGGGVYATVDYTFVVDCPVDYTCFGNYPVTVTVKKDDIPPVKVPPAIPGAPTTLQLQGCKSIIVRVVPGATIYPIPEASNYAVYDDYLAAFNTYTNQTAAAQAIYANDIAAAAASIQQEWASQEAQCRVTPPGNPPSGPPPRYNPKPRPGKPRPSQVVCNDAQTVTCQGAPHPVTVPAGTYCEVVQLYNDRFDVDRIAGAKIWQNDIAYDAAFNQLTNCSICNGAQTGTLFCPQEPLISVTTTIAAGTHCIAAGGSMSNSQKQLQANIKANQDLQNSLAALLAASACACGGAGGGLTVPIGGSTATNNTHCPLEFNCTLNSPFHIVLNPGNTFDFVAEYFAANGKDIIPGTSWKLYPLNYSGPTIYMYVP